jgi:hypothetical protein
MGSVVNVSLGSSLHLANPWPTDFGSAAYAVQYNAKRMKYAQDVCEFVMGPEGRRLQLGDLLTVTVPAVGVAGSYRVREIRRRLTDCTVVAEGYNAALYTFALADLAYENGVDGGYTQNDAADPYETTTVRIDSANLLVNSDFSSHLNSETPSATMIPYWNLAPLDHIATDFSAVSYTVEPETTAGGYLTIVTAGSLTHGVVGLSPTDGDWGSSIGVYGEPGEQFMFSIYADSPVGWYVFGVYQIGHAGTMVDSAYPRIRTVPNTMNGLGWRRYYCIVRLPPTATYVTVSIGMTSASTTYKWEAVQLERSTGPIPSAWKRHPRWGIDPALLTPGELTIRGDGETAHGTVLYQATTTVNTASGAYVDTASTAIQAGWAVLAVTARVTTAITGATTWSLGTAADTTLFASTMAVAGNTTSDLTDVGANFASGQVYTANTAVRVTANGANFSGGVVKVTVHYLTAIAPTS